MRFILTLPFCLLIILAHLSRTTADYCRCDCCTSIGCTPTSLGNHDVQFGFCSELVSCRKSDCEKWYAGRCPPDTAPGQTRAICVSHSGRLLPTVILIIGANFLIRLIKDQF